MPNNEMKEDLLNLQFTLKTNMGTHSFDITCSADSASDLASNIMDTKEIASLDVMDKDTGELYLSLVNRLVVKKVLIYDNF